MPLKGLIRFKIELVYSKWKPVIWKFNFSNSLNVQRSSRNVRFEFDSYREKGNPLFTFNVIKLVLLWHTRFFFKQRSFSAQPQCCLTFSWIELQMLLRCCLIHISIIILRHFCYLLYLCPCLDLRPFTSYLYDLFQTFIFIFIMINPIISWR